MSRGHIYLIHAKDTEKYKIGLTTRSVKSRLKELNGKQSPHKLVLKYSIEVEEAYVAEKYFHSKYKSYCYHNEWFNFSANQVDEVIELMTSYQNEKQKQKSEIPLMIFHQEDILKQEAETPLMISHQEDILNQQVKKQEESFTLFLIKKILVFAFYVLLYMIITPPIISYEIIKWLFQIFLNRKMERIK